MQAILAPEVCPSCVSPLEWKNDMLYCVDAYALRKSRNG